MKIPEIRVTRNGIRIDSVVWDPREGDGLKLSMTDMKVREISRTVTPGEVPTVTVTFVAMLVEVDES